MSPAKKRKMRVPAPQQGDHRDRLRKEFYQAIDDQSLGLRQSVQRLRKMLGMNQREFAKQVGVSPRILMAFEQGSGNPTLETIEKMLKGSGLELSLRRKRRRVRPPPGQT